MVRPKIVLLDTAAVLERFQDHVGDYFDEEEETLLMTIVRQICELLEDWDTADFLLREVASDLIESLNLKEGSEKAVALRKGVLEIAHTIIGKIEQHRLLEDGILYYNFSGMHGYNVVLRSIF